MTAISAEEVAKLLVRAESAERALDEERHASAVAMQAAAVIQDRTERQAQEMREALQGVIAVADRDTVEFDRARRALSPQPREDVTNGCEAREARYVPRPHKLPGLRIPVHVMRRFFNLMGGGRCVGIEVAHRGSIHGVTIYFDTDAEASGFYRSLQAIYELGSE